MIRRQNHTSHFGSTRLQAFAKAAYDFEARRSREQIGAGSRREGEQFEQLMEAFWEEYMRLLSSAPGVSRDDFHTKLGDGYCRLSKEGRSLVMPFAPAKMGTPVRAYDSSKKRFRMDEVLEHQIGVDNAISAWAPADTDYQGDSYRRMFSGKSTVFDSCFVLERNGSVVERVLVEYKTGKSSNRRTLDGNAHERLAFQMLQYVEIAQVCALISLMILVNGAFTKYENKYHPGFRWAVHRLSQLNSAWIDYMTTPEEYSSGADRLGGWLLDGRNYRCAQ